MPATIRQLEQELSDLWGILRMERAEIERLRADATGQQAEIELLKVRLENEEDDAARLRAALSVLLVEYIAGRKEGHIDSFPATARKVVADARDALNYEQSDKAT